MEEEAEEVLTVFPKQAATQRNILNVTPRLRPWNKDN